MRYLIRFSYDGTLFSGYQRQKGYRTVQEELEKAAMIVNDSKKVNVVASGRTDKGVHALDQVAHLDIDVDITSYKLKRALNSNLPLDIHINEVCEVSDDFHARYMAKEKFYQYRINVGEFNPLRRNYVYQHCYPLDINKMREAIKYFEGEHDFRAFVTENISKDDCVRTIYKAEILEDKDEIVINFIGNGFMRYQVRNMVGALIKVGTSKIEPAVVKEILESKVRGKNGSCAKACGLTLISVNLKENL